MKTATYPTRTLKWFYLRIGLIVWPNNPSCRCDLCLKMRDGGVRITDTDVAEELYQRQFTKNVKFAPNPWFMYN